MFGERLRMHSGHYVLLRYYNHGLAKTSAHGTGKDLRCSLRRPISWNSKPLFDCCAMLVQVQFVQLGVSGYNATVHRYRVNLRAQLALLLRTPLRAVTCHHSSIRCRLRLCDFLMLNRLPVNGITLLRLLFLHPILFPTSLHLRDTPIQPSSFLHLLLHSLEFCAL